MHCLFLAIPLVSACGGNGTGPRPTKEGLPPDHFSDDGAHSEEEPSQHDDDTVDDGSTSVDSDSPEREDAGDGASPFACVDTDAFETLHQLPQALAPHVLASSTIEVDGSMRSFALNTGIEHEGLFLWSGTEGGEARNLLFEATSDLWQVVDGETHEPRLAVGGQFLAFDLEGAFVDFSVGYRLDSGSATWTPLPAFEPHGLRQEQVELVTGGGYFVWGGVGRGEQETQRVALASGGYLDASNWSWSPVATKGAPSARLGALSAWTGEVILIYGGQALDDGSPSPQPLSDGFRYDPESDTWSPMADAGAFSQGGTVAVGFARKMLVLGQDGSEASVGAIYDSQKDSWSAVNMEGGPEVSRGVDDLTPRGATSQLVLLGNAQAGETKIGPTLFIYDVEADSWRSHFLPDVLGTPFAVSETVGPRSNMVYLWHEGSLVIWGGEVTTVTYCDQETRDANPGVGCDPKYDTYQLSDGARMRLQCVQ